MEIGDIGSLLVLNTKTKLNIFRFYTNTLTLPLNINKAYPSSFIFIHYLYEEV